MVDGLFIRSLLMAFYFKLFPEIIEDGRLFIAEPPLYRVDDKKNPFVINKEDYINRYVKATSKDYKLGYPTKTKQGKFDYDVIEYLNKQQWTDFLSSTSGYADTMSMLVDHYKVNDRLLEMILEVFADYMFNGTDIDANSAYEAVEKFHKNNQPIIDHISEVFPEIYYDNHDKLIKGVIDGKYQLIEVSESLIRKSIDIIRLLALWRFPYKESFVLKEIKTGTESKMSMLEVLKVLKKYQPNILHRFKGLMTRSF